ncbi:MAG: BamA/TamA family outer membrane protein [Burkholderiales bacterium]|nr:BamA/TamA family outer membrane protein [Burkholderiales bacterium]
MRSSNRFNYLSTKLQKSPLRSPASALAHCILAVMLLMSAAATAQKIDYKVVIDAPDNVKPLIQNNLALIKWQRRERIDEAQFKRLVEEAKAEIETLVATEGYYTPTIDAKLERDGAAWIARFNIALNALVHVGDVQFKFAGALATAPKESLPSIDALQSGWLARKGDVFRQATWEAAKRKVLQQLILTRYPLAAITDSRAEVNVLSGEVTLKVDIDSGPTVTFGALAVTGLKRYPQRLVSDLNPISPGDVYDQSRLLEFQRRLLDTGYFLRVDISAEADMTSPGGSSAPVVVNIVENTLQKVGLGAGYSTNTGSRAQVSYERLNLFDSGVRLKSQVTVETKKQTALIDFLFPTTAEGKRDSIATYFKREDIQNETTRTSGLSGTRAWGEPQLERSVTLAYGRERRDVVDAAPPAGQAATEAGTSTSSSQTLSFNYGITLRRTDNLLSPNKGYLINLQAGAAPTYFLTTTPFGRLYGKYAGYFPLGASNTLILRAEGGVVGAKSRVGIPADFLFRAGGDQSIRGYGYQALGVQEGAAVVGGRYLATGSAEVVHWLSSTWSNWGVAAFVDGGNAADRPADLKPVYGYGTGARWKSPVGVINLDIAYGQAVRQTRLHFSLGVTF